MATIDFRVLVVDDESIVCERVQAELEKLGFAVQTRTDSSQALQCITEQQFDLIITDIKMRGPSGMDITRFVKENCPRARVIVITGYATVETARQALREGAVDFLPKPFKLSELRELVLRLAAEREQSRPDTAPMNPT